MKHQELNNERSRQWYKENSSRARETIKRWREEDLQRYRESSRKSVVKWRKANLTQHSEGTKRWRERNPERYQEILSTANRRRRARLMGSATEKYKGLDVFKRDAWVCQLCLQLVDSSLRYPNPLSKSIHHIIPISLGGPDTFENVCLAHLVCNLREPRQSPTKRV